MILYITQPCSKNWPSYMNRPVLQLRPPKDYLPETSSSHLKVGGWKVILSFSGPAIHGLFSSAMLILGSVWLGHVTRPQPTNPGWVNLFRPNRLLRFNWVGCKTLLLHQKCFKKRMPSLKLAWLVVSTPLKNNKSKWESSPSFGVKIPKIFELPPPSSSSPLNISHPKGKLYLIFQPINS